MHDPRRRSDVDEDQGPVAGHERSPAATAPDRHRRIGAALRVCLKPEHLRRTGSIAVVVGTVLTAINQGDVIAGGDATAGTVVKTALNFLVPFVVSNLGLLAGQRR